MELINITNNNEIILKLFKDNFTTNEEQLFIQNFQMYLEYGDDDTIFPIDFDIVWKWCGFNKKSDAKKLLLKHFKENINYQILLRQLPEQDLNYENNNKHGGNNKESIMLNIDTFKEFCMKASTSKSKEIRCYYIKMEKLINKYFKDNFINTQKMLNEKDKKYLELEIKSCNDKEIARHNTLVKVYNNKSLIYLIKMKSNEDGSFLLKIGWSDNLQSRVNHIKNEFNLDIIVLDVIECELNKKFEKALHHHSFISPLQYKEIINNNKKSQECFLIKDINVYDKINIICNKEKIKYLGRDKELFKLEVDVKKIELLNKYYEKYDKDENLKLIKYISDIFNNPNELSEDIEKKYHNNINEIIENSTKEEVKNNEKELSVQAHLSQGPIVQVYDGEDTTKLLYVFDNIMECTRNIKDTSFSAIKNAAKNKHLYRGYRWHFLNRRIEKDIYSVKDIGNTSIIQEKVDDHIALLNIEKTEVIQVFTKQNEIIKKLSCSASLINTAIKYGNIIKGHYIEYFSKLDDNIKDNYLLNNKLPEKIPLNSIIVQKIDKDTNEILEISYSMEDACKKFKISSKSLKKYSKNNEVYNGFKWKII